MSSSATSISQKPLAKWLGLLVLSLALAIIVIDGTVLNVSISYLIRDLHTDVQTMQWVITSYSLVIAALTIVGGRLGDFFGRKKMFMLGAVIFAIGSFTTAISTNVGMVLLGWSLIEGIGAALMMPATVSLVMSTFAGKDRAIAFGVWGGVAGAASAVGPILGGFFTTYYSWHWAFMINVVTVAVLLIGSVLIKESIDDKEKKSWDIPGILLSSIGLVSLVYGIIESSDYGWWIAKKAYPLFGQQLSPMGLSVVPYLIIAGLIMLAAFVAWELHIEKKGITPLVSMKLFKSKQFSAGVITTTILTLGQSGLIFSIPIFLQAVKGLDAIHTGLALLPMSITLLIVAPLGAAISRKISPRHLIQLGLLVNILALLVLRSETAVNVTAASLAPGLILYGIGMGLVMAQITNITLSGVDVSVAGEASGINTTMRQVGQSLGTAIIGAIFISALTANVTTAVNNNPAIPGGAKASVIAKLSNTNSEFQTAAQDSGSAQTPPQVLNAVMEIKNQSMVDASRSSMLYTVGFVVLCLIVTFYLPNVKVSERHGAPAEKDTQETPIAAK